MNNIVLCIRRNQSKECLMCHSMHYLVSYVSLCSVFLPVFNIVSIVNFSISSKYEIRTSAELSNVTYAFFISVSEF